jgi:tetratricopeptide (TPR) repeat protein
MRSGPTEAIKAFDKAIEIDPRHEIARFNKGVVFLHDLKNFNGAIRTWEELLRINPSARAPGGQPLKELVAQLKRSMKGCVKDIVGHATKMILRDRYGRVLVPSA